MADDETGQGAAGIPVAGSDRAPGRAAQGWTTRRWLTAGVSVTVVLLAVLASLGAWVFARSTSTSNHLVYTTTPALIAAAKLEQSFTDEETGSRGYGLSGQRSFLQPYQDGLKSEQSAAARLHTLLPSGSSGADELTRTLALGDAWKSAFGRPVAEAAPADVVRTAASRADEGKAAFDAFRAESARLQATLRADQARGRHELVRVRAERNWIFSLIAAVVLALMVLVTIGLRRAVTGPLEGLSADVRRVARGDFRHEVRGSGPADIRRLAQDVESMRQRLADELAFSDAARERLDEQATDLRRSNAELEQFAYVASHDLQEPLRKVASFCQLLQRRYADQLDARAGQYIEFAVDGANRMQTLINDLLAFSRVGRLHGESEGVDLEEVFTRTSEALSMAVEDTGAELVHDPLPKVVGDRTQLAMLLQNLVANALKFRRPDVPPRVEVSCRQEDGAWHFAVADNGIGIAPEYAEKVFVIFQRLHTRDAYPGNGIGLALCKKIVEYHGGAIGIDTDRESGARITFTLPVAEPSAERAGGADADTGKAGSAGGAAQTVPTGGTA